MSRLAARTVLGLLAAGILVGGCFVNNGSFWSSATFFFFVFWVGIWAVFGLCIGFIKLLIAAGWLED